MSKKPETIFAEKVDRDLKETFGKDIFIENIQQAAKSGSPDRLICLKGRFIALELKVDQGEPTKLQIIKLARINRAGGYGMVAYPQTWRMILEHIKSTYG